MTRGFARSEYESRTARAQALMETAGLGALLLTTEADVRYFTGFLTRFWESPSRSWFVIVPRDGAPVAVIPSIGEALMARTWIEDIRCWSAPDPEDDGVTLLAQALREAGGPVGVPSGYETYLRMPLADFERVKALVERPFNDDAGIVARLRAVKSPAEIDKIETACAIAGRAFDRMHEIASPGRPVAEVFRAFQRVLLQEGADWVPYLAGGAAQGGYADVISPAPEVPLRDGDVLMLDTGAVWNGYFCDFNRNFAIGLAGDGVAEAHARLIEATQAAMEIARPGARACDLWAAMAGIVGAGDTAGRLGHGLGMQLTEGLSLTDRDETVLEPGMVITLEPGIARPGGLCMVHEENIVITQDAPRALSPLSGAEIPII